MRFFTKKFSKEASEPNQNFSFGKSKEKKNETTPTKGHRSLKKIFYEKRQPGEGSKSQKDEGKESKGRTEARSTSSSGRGRSRIETRKIKQRSAAAAGADAQTAKHGGRRGRRVFTFFTIKREAGDGRGSRRAAEERGKARKGDGGEDGDGAQTRRQTRRRTDSKVRRKSSADR